MAGIKTCQKCGGRGFIEVIPEDPRLPPEYDECDCTERMAIIRNLERGWKGLVKAPDIEETSLLELTRRDVRITALRDTFRSHLRRAGIIKGRNWNFKVVTDADLVRAWLSNVPDGPRGMMSADGEWVPLDHYSHTPLVDLIDPPALLIICLWEQVAKNREMPNVLSQVLLQREHNGKPTWVVDTPLLPFREGHRCYSQESSTLVKDWDCCISLDAVSYAETAHSASAPTPSPVAEEAPAKKRRRKKKEETTPYDEEFVEKPVAHRGKTKKTSSSNSWGTKKK